MRSDSPAAFNRWRLYPYSVYEAWTYVFVVLMLHMLQCRDADNYSLVGKSVLATVQCDVPFSHFGIYLYFVYLFTQS